MLLKRGWALAGLGWRKAPHAQHPSERQLLQQEPSELRFAESSDPVIIPSPGTCSCHHQILPSHILPSAIWGRMERTTLGDEPGLFLPLPGAEAGGISWRMLSPPGHAAELMSRHSPRNERRLALAGSPRLAATALGKELIFTDTFSPNKVVFSSDDTSQPRTQRPVGWRGGSAWKGGERTPLHFSLLSSGASTYFSKFLALLCIGGAGGGRIAIPPWQWGAGARSHPPPLIPGPPQHSGVPWRGCSPPPPPGHS